MTSNSGNQSLTGKCLVAALLCTPLALDQSLGIAPLSVREWNDIESALENSDGDRLGSLVGVDSTELQAVLGVDANYAARLATLLARDRAAIRELERLVDVGISVISRCEATYPKALLEKLRQKAPVVLFRMGEPSLALRESIAVVGSRDISESGREFAEKLGRLCADAGVAVVSGAARGTDRVAMSACLSNGGVSVGVVADSLERIGCEPEVASALTNRQLSLYSQVLPNASFSVGAAMGRNKLIYALCDFAIVVECATNQGGTWSGAMENLRNNIAPLFVRASADTQTGNSALVQRGGRSLAIEELNTKTSLIELLQNKCNEAPERGFQKSGGGDEQAANDRELRGYLRFPRKISEVAEFLKISESKARSILKTEVHQGRVKIIKQRPATYQDKEANDESSSDLFGN